jgi:uncharacterized membrane protein
MYELKAPRLRPSLTFLSKITRASGFKRGIGKGGSVGRYSHALLWWSCAIGALLLSIGAVLLSRDPYVLLFSHSCPLFAYLRVACEGIIFSTGVSLMGVSATLLYAHHSARKIEQKSSHVKSLHRKKLEKVSDVALILGVLFVIVQVNPVLMACCVIGLICFLSMSLISGGK